MKKILILVIMFGISLGTQADTATFEATQLVRYAIDTERLLGTQKYFRDVGRGVFTYDDQYRHPTEPSGPTYVNCSKTKRIGVTYFLQRDATKLSQYVTMYAYWSHSAVNDGEVIQTQQQRDLFVVEQGGTVASSGLPLTGALRVNGLVTVRITVENEPAFENSFIINGCPPLDGSKESKKLVEPNLLCNIDVQNGPFESPSSRCW